MTEPRKPIKMGAGSSESEPVIMSPLHPSQVKALDELGFDYSKLRPVERENDLDWPSADILISYDAENCRVVYSKLSTGAILKSVDVNPTDVISTDVIVFRETGPQSMPIGLPHYVEREDPPFWYDTGYPFLNHCSFGNSRGQVCVRAKGHPEGQHASDAEA